MRDGRCLLAARVGFTVRRQRRMHRITINDSVSECLSRNLTARRRRETSSLHEGSAEWLKLRLRLVGKLVFRLVATAERLGERLQVSMCWFKQRKDQNADAAEILSTFSNFLAIIF